MPDFLRVMQMLLRLYRQILPAQSQPHAVNGVLGLDVGEGRRFCQRVGTGWRVEAVKGWERRSWEGWLDEEEERKGLEWGFCARSWGRRRGLG